jgi:hypothetical protein
MRQTTKDKERSVLKVFHRLLRSGKDYEVNFMYKEAGKSVYLTGPSAGNVIRRHYKKIITQEMCKFVSECNGISHNEKVDSFVKEFGVCKREARLIIRYIKRK